MEDGGRGESQGMWAASRCWKRTESLLPRAPKTDCSPAALHLPRVGAVPASGPAAPADRKRVLQAAKSWW